MSVDDVDAYLAGFTGGQRETLDRLRALIREGASGAEDPMSLVESISYGIPAYSLGGKRMIYFAGWARHYSLYPLGQRIPELLADDLAAYATSKGTVRIPWSEFPEPFLRRLVALRREDAAEGR